MLLGRCLTCTAIFSACRTRHTATGYSHRQNDNRDNSGRYRFFIFTKEGFVFFHCSISFHPSIAAAHPNSGGDMTNPNPLAKAKVRICSASGYIKLCFYCFGWESRTRIIPRLTRQPTNSRALANEWTRAGALLRYSGSVPESCCRISLDLYYNIEQFKNSTQYLSIIRI